MRELTPLKRAEKLRRRALVDEMRARMAMRPAQWPNDTDRKRNA